ncbi:hypothetical protein IEQ34_003311 [Dendrobium chrysotoxum]|uniref:Uncharacterized protein n=1 Tax=Dendrobium chrysotoxum TaxID=161865 RepID=A0AAV7HKY7_DENCH|nr:hypothetical protein IEQ34_003311 [Dendrobium chrysotoxum]
MLEGKTGEDRGFNVVGEQTSSDHDRNLMVQFSGETTRHRSLYTGALECSCHAKKSMYRVYPPCHKRRIGFPPTTLVKAGCRCCEWRSTEKKGQFWWLLCVREIEVQTGSTGNWIRSLKIGRFTGRELYSFNWIGTEKRLLGYEVEAKRSGVQGPGDHLRLEGSDPAQCGRRARFG